MYPFAGDLAEPAFDEVQPTGTGGHKVADEAGMLLKPRPDFGGLVSAVVIHDQMQGDLAGKRFVQSSEKPEELLVTMPRMTFSNHLPLQNLQRREQRGRSVAFVVVRHGSAAASPSAAAKTMRHRRATCCGVPNAPAH